MVSGEHDVYFHHNYLDRFIQDIDEAQFLIVIHAPFLGDQQIEMVAPALARARQRGVRVCVFLELPTRAMTEKQIAKIERLRQWLRKIGVHINLRPNCHEKLAIFDNRFAWDASLNYLSHLETSERLTRWRDHDKLLEIVASHSLDDCEGCKQVAGFCRKDREAAKIALLKVLGTSIAESRKRLGLRQTDLASLLGVRQADISMLETGKGIPSVETLVSVCVALGLGIRPVPWFALPATDAFLSWKKTLIPFTAPTRVYRKKSV